MDNKYDGSPPVFSYSDLPSEYWDELVEAWMCHSDQKLSKEVIQKGKGSSSQEGWTPSSPTQVLVGGSYILVSEAVVITSSISTNDANNMKKVSLTHPHLIILQFLCGFSSNQRTIKKVVVGLMFITDGLALILTWVVVCETLVESRVCDEPLKKPKPTSFIWSLWLIPTVLYHLFVHQQPLCDKTYRFGATCGRTSLFILSRIFSVRPSYCPRIFVCSSSSNLRFAPCADMI
jgi:hypothetical protein